MIEILKLVLESVIKLVPAGEILKQRRSDQVAEIGLRLFDLYRETIAVAENGYAILDALNWVANRHRYARHIGKSCGEAEAVQRLASLLAVQSSAIEALIQNYQELRPLAEVADTTVGRNEFSHISSLLGSKEFFVRILRSHVQGAQGASVAWLLSDLAEADSAAPFMGTTDNRPETNILAALRKRQISIESVPWEPRVIELIGIYLDSGLGRRRLEDIVDSATKLRSAFQNVFKLEDVLFAHERRIKSA